LNSDPGKLLTLYQDLIRIIVRKYTHLGYVSNRESDDLIQEVNRKLLERLPKIQSQYNGSSRLRTYFSVVVRNICLEEIRKISKLEEPQPPEYYKLDSAVEPDDLFLIKQEYERFNKVLRLMFKKKYRFIIMLRYMLDLNLSLQNLSDWKPECDDKKIANAFAKLNSSHGITKKEKYEKLSKVLEIVENNRTSPDSLRKWYTARSSEFISLMNGDPPRSSYSLETLQLLLEKHEILK